MKAKVWFITGASKGLGLSLVRQLLAQGDFVAATSRSKSSLEKAIPADGKNFLPLEVNLTDEQDVKRAIATTVETFGRIDVVVNNAGYGLIGAVEELTDAEARKNFEVNVFGSLNVVRQSLPHLRRQSSGHIINISSIAGYTGDFPGFGIYCATKFAVVGFSEALAVETKPLGINVTTVMPGYFRTNFLNSDSLVTPKTEMAEYQSARDSQRLHQEQIRDNQPGDPEKGATAIIKLAAEQNPPVHLLLGSDTYEYAHGKANAMKTEFDAWKELTTSTNFN